MTTLVLEYETLKAVFDTLTLYLERQTIDKKLSETIVIEQQRDQIHITNVLNFLPTVICHMIGSYDIEEIIVNCYHVNSGMSGTNIIARFSIGDEEIMYRCPLEFTLRFKKKNNYTVSKYASKFIQSFGDKSLITLAVNEYIDHKHNIKNYIPIYDVSESNNYDFWDDNYIDNLSSPIEIIYTEKPSHDLITVYGERNICGIRILDHVGFKFHIDVTKCIMDGVTKYYEKN